METIESQIYILRMYPVFNIEKKKCQYVLYGVRDDLFQRET